MNTILLTGKTRLFPTEALAYFNTTHNFFIADKSRKDKNVPENIQVFSVNPSDGDFTKIFDAGQVSALWYISRSADGGKPVDESDRIESLAQCCSRYGVKRMIVITESSDPTDYRQLVDKYSKPVSGKIKVAFSAVYLPLLCGTMSQQSRLGRIFTEIRNKKTVVLDGEPGTQVAVLPVHDLGALLMRMTAESWFRPGVYSAVGTVTSLKNFREVILSCRPDSKIEYSGSAREAGKGEVSDSRDSVLIRFPEPEIGGVNESLEDMYSLPFTTDWEDEVTRLYSRMLEESSDKIPAKEKLSSNLQRFGKFAWTIVDIAVMFIIAEFLARITSESVYFKIVDVRLLFVVLMGMMHGLAAGTAAAVLECVMLVIKYGENGISGLLLFYNVENWIPFVYYLTAGVISGYTHQKNEQKIRSVTAENELIRNKYLFLNDAYRTSVRDKKELRAQVLSEEESYRKLYDAVRKMSQRTPEAVCVAAVKVFRELLENSTVNIYEADSRGQKALLLSCCRENATRNEIRINQYPEMMETVSSGGTWKNIEFIEGAPMYAAMVSFTRAEHMTSGEGTKVDLLVTVEQAGQDQMNLWYVNHFSILCSLLQDALEHACLRERILE